MRKYQKDLSRNPSAFSFFLKRFGILYCLSGNYKEGRKYFLHSIKLKPLQKGSYTHLLILFISPRIHRSLLKKYCVLNMEGITFYY